MANDPYKYFRLEARELLTQLGSGILELEKHGNTDNRVQRLLRIAHTLKGASRVVKLVDIAEIAHAIEDALSPVRAPGKAVPRDIIDKVLKHLDEIEMLYKNLSAPPSAAVPVQAIATPAIEEQFRTVRADIAEMDALLDGVLETHTLLNGLRSVPRRLAEGSQLVSVLLAQLSQRSGRESNRQVTAALDRAHNTADELRKLLSRLEGSLDLGIERMDRELHQLRGSAEQLRLVSVGSVFSALERLARDVAMSEGKSVTLQTLGGDIDLDAYVLNTLQGALVQILRNAIAHGIEPENERKAAGKPPVGTLKLTATRRGAFIEFRFEDDGRGIDMVAVRKKAEDAGILARGARASDEELTSLLLRGGISTSTQVTATAGRGVGLDIVSVAASQLKGKVEVKSQPGRGTAFQLTVPISVSSIEGLIVEAAAETVTIPLDAVKVCLRVGAGEISNAATGASILFESQAIPFVPLSRALFNRAEPPRSAWSTVVLATTAGLAAVGVDRLVGTARTVVRPLSARVPPSRLLAGASLDAEGNPQLVLDAVGLIDEAPRIAASEDAAVSERIPILVVDDSLTTRMLEQSILESAGYACDIAASGEEGLEAIRRKSYALVLVDVEMPGIDGFTFVEQVRADPVWHSLPVILVTSRNTPEDIRRGEEVRANGYVVKSEFNQTKLLGMIRPLVAGHAQ